ncbi:MAG TPA: transglutaminase family protein [Candidatus Saccharimonadales bacterium]|nr:transglutaminase family protein [Candidatus Saccharimonadales bacterium]
MRVEVEHVTRLGYTADVVESVMDARLGPRSDVHQRWSHYELRVSPAAAVRRYSDSFGNIAHLVTIARPHRAVEVTMCGQIETLLRDPFRLPREGPQPLTAGERADYLDPSPLIPRAPEIAALVAPYRAGVSDVFATAQLLMRLVYDRFEYVPEVTGVGTTVPEILEHKTGVCQDFAHVLISLCRALDIPARYVSGYIVRDSASAAPTRGAGASHAWVEVFTPTHGWRGFDPTNDLVASEHHVKMAVGRDYRDVPPTQGTFRGVADETLAVEVVTRVLI